MLRVALSLLPVWMGLCSVRASTPQPDTLVASPLLQFSYEMRFFRLNIDSLPDHLSYSYREGYLVRHTQKRFHYGPEGIQHQKDSVVFGTEDQRALKQFCTARWQGEQYLLTCKHISPISIGLVLRDAETRLRDGYAPCRSHTIPPLFVELQQFLETFFAPEQRLPFQLSKIQGDDNE